MRQFLGENIFSNVIKKLVEFLSNNKSKYQYDKVNKENV